MVKKFIVVVVVVIGVLLLPLANASGKVRYSAYHEPFLEPGSGEAMVIDAVIFRPIGVLTTVIGGAAFVVSLPFSTLGGNVDEAADKLIVEPIDYTFKRKLGDL